MKCIFRSLSNHVLTGFAISLGGFLLMPSANRAYADGYWVLGSYTAPPSDTLFPCSPNSTSFSTRDNSGGCGFYAASTFVGTPGEGTESAASSGRVTWTAEWIDPNGNFPQPDHGLEWLASGAIAGSIDAPSASATSVSGPISGTASSSTPTKYYTMPWNKPYFNDFPQSGTPQYVSTISAETLAGPDWTGDPTQENPPKASGTSASGSASVQVQNSFAM